jgi:glycosyltransferase involved in cell wall biosynthesis
MPQYLLESLARRAAARAALAPYGHCVLVSPVLRQVLLSMGLNPSKASVMAPVIAAGLRPGCPPERFALVRERRWPLVAFAHHPSPVYGRALLWEAVKLAERQFPRLGVAVFGPGSDSDAFWEAAKSAGVQERMECFGELPHPAALALLKGSDLFVRPTLTDGDAISVREALALGVRCVASDVVPRPKGTRLFRSQDPADLVAQVVRALNEPVRAEAPPDAGPAIVSLYERLWAHAPSLGIPGIQVGGEGGSP